MNFSVTSTKTKETIDITEQVEQLVNEKKIENGLVLIFVKHTTAALTVGEVGEGTDQDLLEVVQKLIPQINFRHGHDPSHAPDHMIGSIVGPSIAIPIWEGKLDLGTWQRVILLELNGPRSLELTLTLVKS